MNDSVMFDEHYLRRATKCLKQRTSRFIPLRDASGNWYKNDMDRGENFAHYLKETF